jgi:iron complex outermembrane receptor protein
VTSSEDGAPVDGAQVQVLGTGEATGTISNAQGIYSISLSPGTYSIVVEHLGYVTERFDDVEVSSQGTTEFDLLLTPTLVALSELVVTASKREEKLVEAPATVYLVGTTEIQERPVATPVEHLREAPGVDIIQHGIQATNVVVRGFNNIFSGSLHALTDHRLAGVPSLRVNLLHFIPANNEDIERMEVVLGPGSALYGPNTANGVLHILTRSPLDSASQGTTLSLAGGNRSVFQGDFRTSYLVNRRLGVKLSGQYIRGKEWEYTDRGEAAAREVAVNTPTVCQAGLIIRGYSNAEAVEACSRVGVRDFDLERYGLEARADYQFAEDGTAILTYGRTSATGIELTGLGAGQTDGWTYQFFQGRMNKGRFFAQAYLNTSDAGDGTYLLRDGVALVDKSKLFVAQAQHGFSLFDDRQDFTYGIDIFRTRPETEGTINGTYEDEDEINEWGIYLQSKTALSDKFDLVLAGRVDDHSMLPEKVYSPRAALVFKPAEDQSLRFTYNRAFSTPTSLNFFLDISAGLAPNESLAALGYTVRAFGTGKDGYSFQDADGSLHGMRSPFAPGQLLPASPVVMWPMVVGVLQSMGSIDAQTAELLSQLDASGLGIMLLNTASGALDPLEATTIPDVPGIRESYTETYEVGWQGVLDQKIRISADVYHTKKNDFISPLLVQNPLLLLNGQDIGAMLQASPLPGLLVQKYVAMGMDLQTAMAQAAATITELATGAASIPAGVAASNDIPSQGPDLIVTYRNIGDVSYWGADLGFSWFIDDKFTLNGAYSWVEKDWFKIEDGAPIALNAPKNKGSLGLAFRDAIRGITAEARVRHTGEFPAESAGYVGTRCVANHDGGLFEEDCVEASTLVDVNFGYRIPRTSGELQLAITNLFDEPYRSFVGVPDIGRFIMARLKYDVF